MKNNTYGIKRMPNKYGFKYNMSLGLAKVLDGLVVVLSLGYFYSSFTTEVAYRYAKGTLAKQIEREKEERVKNEK